MIKIIFSLLAILAISQAQQNLRIATDPSSPPLTFLNSEGAVTGLDVDLLAALAQAAPFQYELVQLSWNDLFDQVQNGEVDLAISGITITDARRETYDFSVPYFLSSLKILAQEGTDITSAQDLATLNKIVGVRDGTTGAGAVEAILGADNANIRRYQNIDEATQALSSGEINAYVDDSAIVEYYANNNPGVVVIADSGAFGEEFFGLLFPKGSELKALIDPAITTVLENGEYAAIYSQWLGATPDVDLLLAAGEEEDPYDVLTEGEETEFGNEEWEWDVADLLLL